MIQDIFPKRLDNAFEKIEPNPEDSAVLIRGHSTWLAEGNSFPKVQQLNGLEVQYRYLFSVDDERFFLAQTEQNPEEVGLSRQSTTIFRKMAPMDRALAGFTAQHLEHWYRRNRFCGCCGSATVDGQDERKLVCPQCGNQIYPRINPAVIVAVTDGDRLLMTRYAAGPVQHFVLIAGFTEIGESAEETVQREVLEEVGLRVKHVRYFGSQPWGCSGNLTLGYVCDLDGDDRITVDEQELSAGKWFCRDEVPVPKEDISLTSAMIRSFAEGKI